MSDINIFSDEDVYLGSDGLNLSGSIKPDQSMDSNVGSKKKKKKKKKKKRKSDKEPRDNSIDDCSPSPEPYENPDLKESINNRPILSSSLASPQLIPKRKIITKENEYSSKRSKIQNQLEFNESDSERNFFSKKREHKSVHPKEKTLASSPSNSSINRPKDLKKRISEKLDNSKVASFESKKNVDGFKETKKVVIPEPIKNAQRKENINRVKVHRKSEPSTNSTDSNDDPPPDRVKSNFSKTTKLVKVLAIDVKKEKPTCEDSKDKKSSNGTPSEVEIEVNTVPRHLPPKHNDAPNAPFPWINMYPDRPNPKAGVPMQINGSKYFTAPEVKIYSDCLTVKNDGNYRVALANYGVSSGTFYYEIKIASRPKDSNLRVGVAQLNVAKQAPLGFDGFGYAFRTDPPTLFHRSRPYDVDIAAQEGDVIGVLLHLPPLSEPEQKEVDFRVWNKKYVYAQFSYEQNPLLPSILKPIDVPCGPGGRSLSSPVPQPEQKAYSFPDPHKCFDQLPLQPGSQLVYFVNGQQVGLPFSNLILAKYYPAVSIYRGAKLQLNFGPDFEFPPPPVWYPRFPLHSGSIGFYPVSQPVQPFSSLVPSHSPFES